jgi:hypothetical protein
MWARMWEARVEPGRLEDAATWVRDRAVPAALAAGATAAEGFRAGGASERVVLISRWQNPAAAQSYAEAAPPDGLLARTHAWVFEGIRPGVSSACG